MKIETFQPTCMCDNLKKDPYLSKLIWKTCNCLKVKVQKCNMQPQRAVKTWAAMHLRCLSAYCSSYCLALHWSICQIPCYIFPYHHSIENADILYILLWLATLPCSKFILKGESVELNELSHVGEICMYSVNSENIS